MTTNKPLVIQKTVRNHTRSVAADGLDMLRSVKLLLFCHAAHIAAILGVHRDDVALIDEEGHADLSTCLQSGGLRSVGSRVTLHTRLRVSDLEIGLWRHLGREDSAVVGRDLHVNDVTFLHELTAGDEVTVDRELLKRLLVHEDAARAVLVEILIRTMLHAHVVELEAYLECTVQHTAVGYILQLGVHDSVALTGFTMLKPNALPDTAVHTDAGTLLDFL